MTLRPRGPGEAGRVALPADRGDETTVALPSQPGHRRSRSAGRQRTGRPPGGDHGDWPRGEQPQLPATIRLSKRSCATGKPPRLGSTGHYRRGTRGSKCSSICRGRSELESARPPSQMNRELVELALGANRVMLYAGYVLLAGTFTFWSLVWPEGRSDKRLVVLAVTGTGLLFLGTIGAPGDRDALRRQAARGSAHPAERCGPAGPAGGAGRDRLPAHRPGAFGRGRLAADLRARVGDRHRRHHGQPVERDRRPLGADQDHRDQRSRARDCGLARWARRARCGVDPTGEPAGARPADPPVLGGGDVQRDHPGDHRHDPCPGHRRRHRAAGSFALRSGAVDQGRRLRSDAAAGQPWPQVRGPGGVPPTAPAVRHRRAIGCATPAACRVWRW